MIPALRRFCAGKDLMEQRVAMRAFEAFVTEEVFNTRDRTGVLIFVSLLEHEVLVIGDSGVNARVRENDWNDIVRRIVKGLRSHSATHGLTEAIRMTGDLLVERGFQRRSDDRNELDDRPREGWDK
jgi:putative membrane protein